MTSSKALVDQFPQKVQTAMVSWVTSSWFWNTFWYSLEHSLQVIIKFHLWLTETVPLPLMLVIVCYRRLGFLSLLSVAWRPITFTAVLGRDKYVSSSFGSQSGCFLRKVNNSASSPVLISTKFASVVLPVIAAFTIGPLSSKMFIIDVRFLQYQRWVNFTEHSTVIPIEQCQSVQFYRKQQTNSAKLDWQPDRPPFSRKVLVFHNLWPQQWLPTLQPEHTSSEGILRPSSFTPSTQPRRHSPRLAPARTSVLPGRQLSKRRACITLLTTVP